MKFLRLDVDGEV